MPEKKPAFAAITCTGKEEFLLNGQAVRFGDASTVTVVAEGDDASDLLSKVCPRPFKVEVGEDNGKGSIVRAIWLTDTPSPEMAIVVNG